MARKILLETGYSFNAASRTITIPRYIRRDRLVLITNVTANQVIYNFSDPSLRATSYTPTMTGANGTTTLVLNYNTTTMANSDALQIIVDEYDEKFTPSETFTDAVGKFRVSEPQALIDTDFEYGTQVTKWENISLVNNRPSFYPSTVPLTGITAIAMSTNARTVTVSTTTPPAVGTPIIVQDTYLAIANGNFVVESVSAGTSFSYTAKGINTTTVTALLDANKTVIYQGSYYTGAAIGAAPTLTVTGTDLRVLVTTTVPHGLSLGNEISVVGITGTNPPNGNFIVAQVLAANQFAYFANPTIGNPASLTATSALIYNRPQSQYLHRPFDGGVLFGANTSSPFTSAIRQTRRQFRYQSGKGIQISSGTLMKPYATIDALTASGTTVTVQTREQHNIQPGTSITVSGATETAYNGTFTVASVISLTKFTYTAGSTPSATPASGNFTLAVNTWYGSLSRLGAFDEQNGLFFEFDGATLYAVRRASTYQVGGKVSVTNGSNTVTQSNAEFPTGFSRQLKPGDFVVLRGYPYKVLDIASDTSMTVNPPYRGPSADYVIASKVVETRIPQSSWNVDKLDGTGPSGLTLDLTKMQMWFVDYAWYGAGTIRWGLRATDGTIVYVHKLANNNVNSEAYMRSGNLPARYETSTKPYITYLTATAANSATSISVADSTGFPNSGVLLVRNATQYEYMNYTGKTTTSFTGLTRAQAGSAVTGVTTTWTSGTASGVVSSATGIQIGQRVFSATSPSPVPEGTFVTNISGTTITLSNALGATNPNLIFAPMGNTTAQTFTYSATAPIAVELAYATFAPPISHWGTSAIMDGKFDDDKSLIFTYGQTAASAVATGASKALMSIRVAPSVDNGITGVFGAREIINRMQLQLKSIGISTDSATSNLLVRIYLNGVVSASTTWTNAVGNIAGAINSSLAQIADHGTGSVTIAGGEVSAGLFVTGTDRLDLSGVRDLGNSILGGGTTTANTQIYPDGPDIMTIVVTNLGASSVNVLGRISWTEAQA